MVLLTLPFSEKNLFNLSVKISQMEGAEAGWLQFVYLFVYKTLLLPLATGSKAIPNRAKQKNGPLFPKCGWWTKGSQMRQKWALSLKHLIAHTARPLIFNTFYFCVWGGFVFVNLPVQQHSVKTFGINMPNASCTVQWLWGECFLGYLNLNTTLLCSEEKHNFNVLELVWWW